MDKDVLKNLWPKLTAPNSNDENEARQEHTTKVVLFVANVMMLLVTPLATAGAMGGILAWNFPRISVIATAFLLGGWWLAYRGQWRLSSYLILAVVFLNAFYNNYLDGVGTTAMAYYAVAILLTAMLQGVKALWIALALSLGSYAAIGWAHVQDYLPTRFSPEAEFITWLMDVTIALVGLTILLWFLITQLQTAAAQSRAYVLELAEHKTNLEERVAERTAELETAQQELIQAQKKIIVELSTPIIPILDQVIVMPLIGSIDSMRARDITRSLLAGINEHRAEVVILDVTGVTIVDSGVANHLNKTIRAARLKGAHTIVTGISDTVAETIVDLGIDWSELTTLSNLQTGLMAALGSLGLHIKKGDAK